MKFCRQPRLIIVFAAVLLLTSCASNEIGQIKDVNPETVYQQYRFVYDEKDKSAEMISWLRFAGENGTTLVLTPPSKLEYDGMALTVDSSDFGGAFYKALTPGQKVIGKHELLFTGIDNKRYQNHFTIDSFTIEAPASAVSRLVPLQVHFKATALGGDDYIELSSDDTDSSFSVKYTAGEKGNAVTIPAAELQRQKKNDFSIVATLYRKLPLREQAKEGGAITIIHTKKPIKIQLKKEEVL